MAKDFKSAFWSGAVLASLILMSTMSSMDSGYKPVSVSILTNVEASVTTATSVTSTATVTETVAPSSNLSQAGTTVTATIAVQQSQSDLILTVVGWVVAGIIPPILGWYLAQRSGRTEKKRRWGILLLLFVPVIVSLIFFYLFPRLVVNVQPIRSNVPLIVTTTATTLVTASPTTTTVIAQQSLLAEMSGIASAVAAVVSVAIAAHVYLASKREGARKRDRTRRGVDRDVYRIYDPNPHHRRRRT